MYVSKKYIRAREIVEGIREIIGKDSNAEAPYGRNKKDEATKIDEIHACGTETKDHGAKWRRKRKKVDSRAISRQRGEHAPARTIEKENRERESERSVGTKTEKENFLAQTEREDPSRERDGNIYLQRERERRTE